MSILPGRAAVSSNCKLPIMSTSSSFVWTSIGKCSCHLVSKASSIAAYAIHLLSYCLESGKNLWVEDPTR